MATTAFGSNGVGGSWFEASFAKGKKKRDNKKAKLLCCSSLRDQYRTLQIEPGASESEVKKAFRTLALKYHPDVCKGSNCGVQFHQINEAYDILMSNLREKANQPDPYESYNQNYGNDDDESATGSYDSDWELWEEWMGWEGAGIRDYSSHINPYI